MSEIRVGKGDSIQPSTKAEPDPKANKVSNLIKNTPPTTLSGKSDFLKGGLEGIEAKETTGTKKIQKTFRKVYSINDKK